jgi:tetratricopeptide (TPR) repeat protein
VTLAEVLFGLQPDEVFCAALREASGGIPLYVASILDAVARQQIAPIAEQAPRLLELGGEALSRGVGLRLSRLPDPAVRLVRAAAILGDHTELALAAALADLDTVAALDGAGTLVNVDLLERENPVAFRHPVVRSAVLEDMSAGMRMRLHRRAAEVLLDSGAVPEQAATYLMSTIPGRDSFVVATLRQAARRSLSRGAPEAALGYLRRALEEPPPPDERPGVLAEVGIAESAVGKANDAAVHLRQALDGLEDIAQRPDLVLAYVYALALISNRSREPIELLEELGERFRGDPVLNERITAQLMIASHYVSELYPTAREQWDAATVRDRAKPIQAGVLLAEGALEEARRGLDRQRAVELARRAVACGIASSDERLFLV